MTTGRTPRNGFRNAIPDEEWEKVLTARAAGWSQERIWHAGLPCEASLARKRRSDPEFAARYDAAFPTKYIDYTKRWTEEETAFLEANRLRMSAPEIGAALGKSAKAVMQRVRRLRMWGKRLDGSYGWWRVEENAFVRANAGHMTAKAILRFLPGRKIAVLKKKIFKLDIPGGQSDGPKPRDLLGLAIKAIPAQMPRHARDDIASAIMVAALEGKFGLHEIAAKASGFVTEYHRMHPSKYGPVSLDAPVFGDGDRTPLVERIAEDAALW